MELNDLLQKHGIDLTKTIVMRHRPREEGVRKVLPWLVHERPEVFNSYQQSHKAQPEAALAKLAGDGCLASFIGMEPGEAVFAGLYAIRGLKEVSFSEFWKSPGKAELKKHGLIGWEEQRKGKRSLWFDLRLNDTFYSEWIGRLVVGWPSPERSWWRRAGRNRMPVLSIAEESRFAPAMPDWRELVLSWQELKVIPASWRAALHEWRGIYLIRDLTDGLAYVGSAYGRDNLLGRWQEYARSGDGGNRLLKLRKPDRFQFSILERLWSQATWSRWRIRGKGGSGRSLPAV